MNGNATNATERLKYTFIAAFFEPISEIERDIFRYGRKPTLIVKLNTLRKTMEQELPFHEVPVQLGWYVVFSSLIAAAFIEIVKSKVLRMDLYEVALFGLGMINAMQLVLLQRLQIKIWCFHFLNLAF
jgi:hypothetical protein